MDERAKQLIKEGDNLFSKRLSLMSLWQEQADQFYVERADFTVQRSLGLDFASHLTTSYPLLCRRDLGNIIGQILRPADKEWYEVSTLRDDKLDDPAKKWLEWSGTIQRRAMYDPAAQFQRATKEGDHDFATFGQCVPSVQLNRELDGLLYRTWHLRDVAWSENYKGVIDTVHRKWKPQVREVIQLFGRGGTKDNPGRLDPKIYDIHEKNPFQQVEFRHIVKPADEWEAPVGKKWREPYVSIFIDVEHQCVVEEIGSWVKIYPIARWQTVSGSQYAYSPATVCALPDARLIQAMSLVLLEAGEKAVDPPMVTPGGVIRGDVNVYAGGITAYDKEYDEKLGEVLRVIPHDYTGFNFGLQLRTDVRDMIGQAFFLNKIALPSMTKQMTAFEVSQRVTEYVRNALPIFEPMEAEYNGGLCEMTFDILMRGGAFGSPLDMPKSLRGQDIKFKFQSPLHGLLDQQKGAQFNNAKAMLAEAAALDPGAVAMVDPRKALRDALEGIGTPKAWMLSDAQMQEKDQLIRQQQQTQQLLTTMGQGADVAKKLGDAQTALSGIPSAARAQVAPQVM